MGAVLNDVDGASDRPLNENAERAVKIDYSESHYDAIKKAIIQKEITPAQKPVMRKLIALNVKFSAFLMTGTINPFGPETAILISTKS